MRKKIVAGNWKMNLSLEQGVQLASDIAGFAAGTPFSKLNGNPEVVMFTPFIHLAKVVDKVKDINGLKVGAQNCHTQEKGAFTGEISAEMIKSVGADYVLVGHSERRQYFGETDEVLAEKVKIALKNNLTPVYCCGEVLDERNAGIHFDVVRKQIDRGLFWLSESEFSRIVIAYEPVWAIGTGVTASPEQAQEMHAYIRNLVKAKYNNATAENTVILYGGSCNAQNAKELFANKDVDGGLIGGASLKKEDFCTIIQSY